MAGDVEYRLDRDVSESSGADRRVGAVLNEEGDVAVAKIAQCASAAASAVRELLSSELSLVSDRT